MKGNKLLLMIISTLCLLSCNESNNEPFNSEGKEALEYYPLKVGDLWIYDMIHSGMSVDGTLEYIVKKEVLKDSVLNGNKYFLIKFSPIFNDSITSNQINQFNLEEWRMIDENEGTLFRRPKISWPDDIYLINLAMKEGDTVIKGEDTARYEVMCLREYAIDFFGLKTVIKKYEKYDAYQAYKYDFAKGIGMTMFQQLGEYNDYNMTLKGAKIGEDVYGDTSIVK